MSDPVTRRHFVKLMSASFLLGGFGLTGCRRPVEHIYPFSKMPEGYVHGLAKFYATALPVRGSAIPLLAKSNDGRPTKLEGNAQHPDSNGGTDRYAQATILNLYDPDRATRHAQDNSIRSRTQAADALKELAKAQQSNGGKGLAILAEQSSSPSRARLQKLIASKLPQSKWYEFEPVDFDIHRQAATIAFGKPVKPLFKFASASVIVSLDSDFLGSEEHLAQNIRGFADSRRIKQASDAMSRLYTVEALMTLTGMNADHRLRLPSSLVPALAAKLAAAVLGNGAVSDAVKTYAGVQLENGQFIDKWVTECAADLKANNGKCLVVAGHRQPLAVHLLAHALNSALGSVGKTVVLLDAPDSKSGSIAELAQQIKSGAVETLVMVGGNPAYSAPADLDWSSTLEHAAALKSIVRLAYYEDESFAKKGWNLAQAHYLESWGDARTADGTLVPIQPLIEPLFGGMSELELLGILAGLDDTNPYEITRATFRELTGGGEEDWKKFLWNGFQSDSSAKSATAQFDSAATAAALARESQNTISAPSKDKLEVIFHRDYKMDDGRFNNNGWMQELPDPITKLTWENVFLVSVKTAKALGLYFKNDENNRIHAPLAELTLDGRKVVGPVWPQPGQADNTIGLALGYGRSKSGRVGQNSGYNAYALRTSKNLHCAVGGKLAGTGKMHPLSVTQDHGAMEGRPIIREANLEEYRNYKKDNPKGSFAHGFDMEKPKADYLELYPNPLDERKKAGLHQWGMSIDLSACVGCSSCMIACQSENNVPIVGKYQVSNNREMHWIRIDRYFTGTPENEDAIQAVNQPMLCQHCESAPCENVCPVNATTHDQEGLNVMVYNRCVGTRYCSNNCPYKVRRFNFFDYNRRPLELLNGPVYSTPLWPKDAQRSVLDWWKDPDRGNKPSDEWDMLKLSKNPEVTVRMRGVMEKCTFCLQRIEAAKIAQKVKARDSADVVVPDGVIKTACQQACPAEAIVFGNVADPESRVSKLKSQDRDYSVLDFLNTKPRLTYLARIRNPNPKMPDFYKTPNSTQEFENTNHADPFKSEEEGHAKVAENEKGAS